MLFLTAKKLKTIANTALRNKHVELGRGHLFCSDDEVVVKHFEVYDVVFESRLAEATVIGGDVNHRWRLTCVTVNKSCWRTTRRKQVPEFEIWILNLQSTDMIGMKKLG